MAKVTAKGVLRQLGNVTSIQGGTIVKSMKSTTGDPLEQGFILIQSHKICFTKEWFRSSNFFLQFFRLAHL